MNESQVRKEQESFGRRTIRVNPKNKKTSSKPTGHEGYLKGLQESGAQIAIMTTGGDVYEGKIKHADKYTISVEVEAISGEEPVNFGTFVFFKSAIEYFRALTPPPHLTEKTTEETDA